MMRVLSGHDWDRKYRAAFRSLFVTLDPFDAPLSQRLDRRLLAYPIPLALNLEQVSAVFSSVRTLGEESAIVTLVEAARNPVWNRPRHFELSTAAPEAYVTVPNIGVTESAVYSPRGEWGIMVSHEWHAVVGGSATFVDSFSGALPTAPEALREFREFWSGVPAGRRRWLESFVAHLDGSQVSE